MYLDKIDSSAARMTSLIKDVLAYSQATDKEMEKVAVDLNEIIQNVIQDFELLIDEKNVSITCDQLPVVRGSKRQLHQLFYNLISNSIKFNNTDPVIRIKANVLSELPKELDNGSAHRYHEISITDNGIGFEPTYSQQIFQLFGRLHNRKDYGGTGIGLSLCKKIVENHNGAVTATSEKGFGSTFTIYLPHE
jgi:signal transduction histidine kinase